MKPLYVLIRANSTFEKTGGSSTPERVKIYEELSMAEKQCRIANKPSPFIREKYPEIFPIRVVIYRPTMIETRG